MPVALALPGAGEGEWSPCGAGVEQSRARRACRTGSAIAHANLNGTGVKEHFVKGANDPDAGRGWALRSSGRDRDGLRAGAGHRQPNAPRHTQAPRNDSVPYCAVVVGSGGSSHQGAVSW